MQAPEGHEQEEPQLQVHPGPKVEIDVSFAFDPASMTGMGDKGECG